ncbi:hypothetical protein SVAN01_01531 [Stagonosporopsis vannaccii]|nr:hypothetical protein SVAN01_01531 [Stagonosporopsis vannaccii]
MKRFRSFLAATFLLLGVVYIFLQHPSMSLSAEPATIHTGSSTITQQTQASPEPGSVQQAEKNELIDESSQPVPESASTSPASLIGANFQDDLTLELPVDNLNSLDRHSPHNYDPKDAAPYAYATFFASRNPSIEDPYYLAIHSLIYRVLWSPRSKTSKHPFVVFVADFVSPEQRRLLAGAGAVVRDLAPLPWHPTDPGVQERWKDLFAKLHMWNETSFSRIFFLDADALPMAPIDDVFELKKVRNCIESKMQLDDFLPSGEPICEPYLFAGVSMNPFSIFDVEINVGSMVFTPNAKQYQRLLQNYLKFDKYDVKMAEQAFLNWQFGINSAYPPAMLPREYGAFFPKDEGEKGLKVVHEKIWAAQRGPWKDEWDNTWKEMNAFYGSGEFVTARRSDGEVAF